MKKILVVSDSHGNMRNMTNTINKERPDMILHLGDLKSDGLYLKKLYSSIAVEVVPGNCDFSSDESEKILEIEGKKILMCHGHHYNVKSSYIQLELRARELGVDIALFGHTHMPFVDRNNGVMLLNPGSIGEPRWGKEPSYAIFIIDEEAGTFEYRMCVV